ncbi:MAG: SRPBCC family protein [bacterium]
MTTTKSQTKRGRRSLKIGAISLIGGVAAIVLLFNAYHWIADLFYKPKPETAVSQRPRLGLIELTPGHSPDGIPGWVAEFNLDASVDEVWRIFRDCRNMAKALKTVHYCKTLEKGDGWELNYMKLSHAAGWYLKQKTWFEPKKYASHWKMVEGSFTAAAGHFRVGRIPGRPGWCRVSYGYYIKINPLLPKRFERDKNKKAVRNMAREIQQYVADVRRGPAKAPSK